MSDEPKCHPGANSSGATDAVPVAILSSSVSAHMVRCILEDAGIPAAVVGEHAASTLSHLGQIMSVSVLVPRGDYDRAVAALDEAVLGAGAPTRCAACGYDLSGLEAQTRCPECGAKYEDLRRRISIAPRPGAPGESAAIVRIGAVVGVLVLVGIVVAIVAIAVWGMRP